MKKSILLPLLYLLTTHVSATTLAKQEFESQLLDIQKEWATVNYTLKDKAQQTAYEQLQTKSEKLVETHPEIAAAWIWHGIVQSSFAGAKGGLSALSLVDGAKEAFQKAIVMDELALDGSAHTSLGILYLKVPGWPISFGSDDKSEHHLLAAQKINPNGIDVNYFLAQYYIEQEELEKAKQHLLLAQVAPQRPNRENADKFRQQEIAVLLNEVNQQLAE